MAARRPVPASSARARHGGARPGLAGHGARPRRPPTAWRDPPCPRAPALGSPAPLPPVPAPSPAWARPSHGCPPAARRRGALARPWCGCGAARLRPPPGAAPSPAPLGAASPARRVAAAFRRAPGVPPRLSPLAALDPGHCAASPAHAAPVPAWPRRARGAPARPVHAQCPRRARRTRGSRPWRLGPARPGVSCSRHDGPDACATRSRRVSVALRTRVFAQQFGVARRARDATHSALSRSRHDCLPPSHPSTPLCIPCVVSVLCNQ
jgi:hypothetical protein